MSSICGFCKEFYFYIFNIVINKEFLGFVYDVIFKFLFSMLFKILVGR